MKAFAMQEGEKRFTKSAYTLLVPFLSFQLAIFSPLATIAKAKQTVTCSTTSVTATPSATSLNSEIPASLRTNPIAHSASLIEGAAPWSFTSQTRIVVNEEQSSNARLQEVAKLAASQILARGLSASLAFGTQNECNVNDIYISLVPASSITQNASVYDAFSMTIKRASQQGEQATQGAPDIVINAATENAIIYAFNFLQNLYLLDGNKIPASTITDWADLPERRLFIDCGRKYFSKDWFIQTIREMSYLKLNTLDMHFSENMGFRVQCDTDPAIVSDQYLTKAEVRAILAEAQRYGIDVIPSFDSPGHVDAILKVHPEYGQISTKGEHYGSGLDITSSAAVDYMKSLYKEYFDLFGAFSNVKDFSIGADEYMEFDREPFFSKYQPVLDDWAHENLGPDYCWTDTLATYINNMAQFCKENGLRPRVFNDGLYYGENKSFKQKVELDPNLVVDFWSTIPWNSDVASLQTLLDRGLTDFSNINSGFTYFVLRTDGEASFDYSTNTEQWWRDWRPDLFPGQNRENGTEKNGNVWQSILAEKNKVAGKLSISTAATASKLNVLGTGICVWCDDPTLCSEDAVTSGIGDSLRYMACRTSNIGAPEQLSMDDFQNLILCLGHAAGWEKGSALPDPGGFQPMISADNTLPATGDPFVSGFLADSFLANILFFFPIFSNDLVA